MDAKRDYKAAWKDEDQIKFFTRNKVWSDRTPAKGRGIILGGAWHSDADGNTNVQDFLAQRFPGRPIFILRLDESD
jgi:hypothetical protein